MTYAHYTYIYVYIQPINPAIQNALHPSECRQMASYYNAYSNAKLGVALSRECGLTTGIHHSGFSATSSQLRL